MTAMDAHERMQVEAACTRLMHEFTWRVDACDYDGVVALFVPDCTFSRADKVFKGIDGLRVSLNARPRDRMTRHLCTNILIDVADANYAAGKCYALVFGHRGALQPGEEAPLGVPDSLILYHGTFVHTDAGWRIKSWHIELSFRKPAN